MSCEDVFDALIIKIATNTIPTAIPIKTSTMYHTTIQTGIKIDLLLDFVTHTK